MNRLTKRNEDGSVSSAIDCPNGCKYFTCSMEEGKFCCHECEADYMCKLADYEDLEEQGLLLRLPCKVGDVIYKIPSKVNYDLNIVNKHPENNRVYEQPVYSIQMWNNYTYVLNTCDGLDCVRSDSFKETWFLTREEAEKALEEMG